MTELDDTIQPQEPTIKEVNNELDELLANPFSDATAAPSVQVDPLQAVGADAPAPRMIDRLPKERQVQAKALAEQIDVANAQAIMSYGAAAQQN